MVAELFRDNDPATGGNALRAAEAGGAAVSGAGGHPARSLLLVHAHPDDESIFTGATMAKYAAAGARVTLVTCTLGELGEIIPPDLRHLFPDELGQHRIVELDRACAALGVTDHRFLGEPGKYRDSGMIGLPDNEDPRCFWQASVDEAATELAKVIEEVAADVVVTYDANGSYGHPDHIQAHRVTVRARELTGGRARLYATAMPRSVLARALELPEDSWFRRTTDLSVAVPDDAVTTEIDAPAYLPAKLAAMAAHETQITVDGEFFALSNDLGQRVLATEYYTLLSGGVATVASGTYERDLFPR
jgi:N-acetyl-1-D-myo-inositol-2-amino-2-deoxy-alpha-D-glucopyranoside deacetylase